MPSMTARICSRRLVSGVRHVAKLKVKMSCGHLKRTTVKAKQDCKTMIWSTRWPGMMTCSAGVLTGSIECERSITRTLSQM